MALATLPGMGDQSSGEHCKAHQHGIQTCASRCDQDRLEAEPQGHGSSQ